MSRSGNAYPNQIGIASYLWSLLIRSASLCSCSFGVIAFLGTLIGLTPFPSLGKAIGSGTAGTTMAVPNFGKKMLNFRI